MTKTTLFRIAHQNFYRRELASLERKHVASLDTIHTALIEGSARVQVAIDRLARTLEQKQ